MLTEVQLKQFEEDGYLTLGRVTSNEQLAKLQQRLETSPWARSTTSASSTRSSQSCGRRWDYPRVMPTPDRHHTAAS